MSNPLPTEAEMSRRDAVLASVRDYVTADRKILLPDFDRAAYGSVPAAFPVVGQEPNPFCGVVGSYRYQLEGEEDLLHLIVTRLDGEELSVAEGQWVAGFVFPGVPPGLVWLRPGHFSQNFYVGHDELVAAMGLP